MQGDSNVSGLRGGPPACVAWGLGAVGNFCFGRRVRSVGLPTRTAARGESGASSVEGTGPLPPSSPAGSERKGLERDICYTL